MSRDQTRGSKRSKIHNTFLEVKLCTETHFHTQNAMTKRVFEHLQNFTFFGACFGDSVIKTLGK